MQTALLFLGLFSCFSLIEGKSLEVGETCLEIPREDSSYDFDLPDSVVVNAQDRNCDAEWTIDQFTAILDGNSAHFSHPFKNVTRQGISVSYCPFSVRFHVSCPKYTKYLTCSCSNSTNNPVFSTTLPSRDISSSVIKTDSSVRQHYCAIAVVATFVITLVILAFLICRTNRTAKYAPTRASADEQNQPGSELA